MNEKICTKCFNIKTLDFFTKKGKSNICKKCASDAKKEYRKKISERNKKYQKEYRLKNKEILKKKEKQRNKTLIRIENQRKRNKERYEKNKDYILKKDYEYKKNKLKTDPMYKLLRNVRKRSRDCLVNKTKKETTVKLISCDKDFFRQWFEFQFDIHMNWENYGKYWQIDHVKPCSLFDFTKKEDRIECLHWKNTRPLEISKNASKCAKYNNRIQLLHDIIVKVFLNQYGKNVKNDLNF